MAASARAGLLPSSTIRNGRAPLPRPTAFLAAGAAPWENVTKARDATGGVASKLTGFSSRRRHPAWGLSRRMVFFGPRNSPAAKRARSAGCARAPVIRRRLAAALPAFAARPRAHAMGIRGLLWRFVAGQIRSVERANCLENSTRRVG